MMNITSLASGKLLNKHLWSVCHILCTVLGTVDNSCEQNRELTVWWGIETLVNHHLNKYQVIAEMSVWKRIQMGMRTWSWKNLWTSAKSSLRKGSLGWEQEEELLGERGGPEDSRQRKRRIMSHLIAVAFHIQ